jgi:RNA polymerase sigma-70 factor (ECF subfamily)
VIIHEPEILAQAINGNSDAFTALVEAYQNPVYNLCYRMLGDPVEAEDAAQETFMRAYINLKRYDHKRSFSTWLLSIAAHYCIDQLRKRRIMYVSLDGSPDQYLADHAPGPEASINIHEDQVRLQTLLSRLGAQDRAAVVMFYWYDFTYEEIASMLSLTVSAVKSRLHRARLDMAQYWLEQTHAPVIVERSRHESPAF